ncbi:MAG: Xaa-Pro dipeptidase [Pseudohongiellaceae bacterium]
MQPLSTQFADHIRGLCRIYSGALEQSRSAGAILLHSGIDRCYYADDQTIPFRACPHFAHWLPVNRPDQLLLVVPGERPIWYQIVRPDFWHDQNISVDSWWGDSFTIQRLPEPDLVAKQRPDWSGVAYIGEDPEFARSLGIEEGLVNPSGLIHRLNYYRAYKSAWEISQIKQANQLALTGHRAAESCFQSGGSEYEIHTAYLNACGMLEHDTPYSSIVALDDRAAILHYQHKRRNGSGTGTEQRSVLLIDAGCRINGYCSDITRTSTRPHVHPVFRSLVAAVEQLEQALVTEVAPGMSYVALHESAIAGIGNILLHHEICRGDLSQLMSKAIAGAFMPHGVGHLIGLQVHDVGGYQCSPKGDSVPPPENYPALRNTRIMEEGMVFTVEPGLYFIPMLLDPWRHSSDHKLFNWRLIDELLSCGGIRVEDNILVTGTGSDNLTCESIAE